MNVHCLQSQVIMPLFWPMDRQGQGRHSLWVAHTHLNKRTSLQLESSREWYEESIRKSLNVQTVNFYLLYLTLRYNLHSMLSSFMDLIYEWSQYLFCVIKGCVFKKTFYLNLRFTMKRYWTCCVRQRTNPSSVSERILKTASKWVLQSITMQNHKVFL